MTSSSSTCMVNSPIRFMALSSSACTGSPLRCLSEASIPPIAFLTPLLEPEDLYAQLARQKLHRLVTQKPQNDPHACAPPSIAGQVPAGLPAKPGLGKTWTSQARPHLPQGPSTATFFSNYRSCSGPPWTLRLSQFCVQGNRVRLNAGYGVAGCSGSPRGAKQRGRSLWARRGNHGLGVQDGSVFGEFRRFWLCLSRKLSPFISRMWTWWVRRSSKAPVRRSEPKISVHSSNGKLEVMITEPRS